MDSQYDDEIINESNEESQTGKESDIFDDSLKKRKKRASDKAKTSVKKRSCVRPGENISPRRTRSSSRLKKS